MLGLGLGSLAGGWLSRRRDIPLLPLLATIEIFTGSFGLFSLTIFDRVGILTAGAPLFVIAAINLGLVALPTLLMGATLPLLVAHLVRATGRVGSSVGQLYYVNTLGAAFACFVATLALFPFFGMQGSIYVAVALNAAVATGALVAHTLGQATVPASSGETVSFNARSPGLRLSVAAAPAACSAQPVSATRTGPGS